MSEIHLTTDWHLFNLKHGVSHENITPDMFIKSNNFDLLFDKLYNIPIGDVIVVHGDIAYRDENIPPEILLNLFKDSIKNIGCYKILIKGNHDTYDDEIYYQLGFDAVCTLAYFDNIFLSHRAIKIAYDEVNIHGDIHNKRFMGIPYNHIALSPVENSEDPPIITIEDALNKLPSYSTPDFLYEAEPKLPLSDRKECVLADTRVVVNLRELFDEITEYPILQESGRKSVISQNYKKHEKINLDSLTIHPITQRYYKETKESCKELKHTRVNAGDTASYAWEDDDGTVVALLTVTTKGDGRKSIQNIFVSEEYRGYGLGKQVLDYAVKTLGANCLTVDADNEVAKKMYSEYGFIENPAEQDNTSRENMVLKESSSSRTVYTFNDVKNIVNRIPKSEHHLFYNGSSFKDSPYTKYRDVMYASNGSGGFIEIYVFDNEPNTGIIVIATEPSAREKGIATDLVKKAVKSMPSLNIEKLVWRTDKRNVKSIKLAEKLGFTNSGIVDGKHVLEYSIPSQDKIEMYLQENTHESVNNIRLDSLKRIEVSESYLKKITSNQNKSEIYKKVLSLKPSSKYTRTFVWENYDGEIVCYLSVSEPSDKNDKYYGYIWIEDLYVSSKFRKKGLGNQILRYATDKLGANALGVEETNVVAKEMYHRRGFRLDKNGTKGNSDNIQLMYLHESSNTSDITEIIELNKKLNRFGYGTNFSTYDGEYHISSPKEFERNKGGVCWDFAIYEAYYLHKFMPNIKYTAWCILCNVPNIYPNHTFITFPCNGKYIYIESSFSKISGVWIADSEKDIINFVLNSMDRYYKKYNILKKEYVVYKYDALNNSLPGMTGSQFMHFLDKHGDIISHRHSDKYSISKLDGSDYGAISESTRIIPDAVHPVYVILMHTGSGFSNIIQAATKDKYTHSSISLDTSLEQMYTFNMNGFYIENYLDKFFQSHPIPFSMYMVPLTEKEFTKLKNRLDYFIQNKKKFTYDAIGCVRAYFGFPDNPQDRYFCSRFVADILNSGKDDSNRLIKEPSLVYPSDFIDFSFTRLVYQGYFNKYNRKDADKNAKQILESIKNNNEAGFVYINGEIYNSIQNFDNSVIQKYLPKHPWLKHFNKQDSNILIKDSKDKLIGAASVTATNNDDGRCIKYIHVDKSHKSVSEVWRNLINLCITKLGATEILLSDTIDSKIVNLLKSIGFKNQKKRDGNTFLGLDKSVMHKYIAESANERVGLQLPSMAFDTPIHKTFKIILNRDGSIRLTSRDVDDLSSAYKQSLKMIRMYRRSNNLAGLKSEACKLYYIIQIIDRYYMVNKNRSAIKPMIDLRSSIYSTLSSVLKDVTEKEPSFDFSKFYATTKYSTDFTLPKIYVSALSKVIQTLITL